MQMEQFQIQIKIIHVMYMIWQVIVLNGRQKPIAIPTIRAWNVEAVATSATTTLALVATLPLMPTTTVPFVLYFMLSRAGLCENQNYDIVKNFFIVR